MSWKVCRTRNPTSWIGIVETNYAWAFRYWSARGFKLVAS